MHHQGHCEGRRAFWSGVSATGSDAPSKLGPNRPLGDDRFKKASGCAARHGENFGSIPWRLSLFINALRTKKQRQKDTYARWPVQFGKARPVTNGRQPPDIAILTFGKNGFTSHVHRRNTPNKPMPAHIRRSNATKSKHCAPIEHFFSHQKGPKDLAIRISAWQTSRTTSSGCANSGGWETPSRPRYRKFQRRPQDCAQYDIPKRASRAQIGPQTALMVVLR